MAVAKYLDMTQCGPVQPDGTRLSLPHKFLLELAAVIQLGIWEHEGFRVHIEQGLPSYEQAVTGLLERSQQGVQAFHDLGTDSLCSQMVVIHWQYFAWEADTILGKTVAVQVGSEDELAAALAEFLWENREYLSVAAESQQP
ncbi:MAG: hypothetical protein ACYC4U_31565 [Pirellulaceae bacterium]